MNKNTRVELTDSLQDILIKLSDGNPGAVFAMMEILSNHDSIDPQAALGGIGALLMFDTWGIYGTEIYILFNDKCDRDVRKLLVLMRAAQLGYMSSEKLKALAEDQMRSVNLSDEEFAELDDKVCGRLTEFKRAS